MAIKIEIVGLQKVIDKFSARVMKAQVAIARRVNAAAYSLQSRILSDLRGGVWRIKSRHGTSGLAGSVVVSPAGPVGTPGPTATVKGGGGTSKYGVYWEGGIRAHDIVPVSAKALAWPAYGPFPMNQKRVSQRALAFTKDMIFAKRVHIPAQAPRPWFSGPYRLMKSDLEAMVASSAAEGSLFE